MSDSNTQPTIYIIAGPNGAGKTTFAKEFLPKYANCREFLNADLIAAGLSPFNPERANFQAAQLMLERIESLTTRRKAFAVETNLSGRSYLRMIPQWKSLGYEIAIHFFWLPSADLAIRRVANRVKQGGHNIPTPTIRRRYQLGLVNFFENYLVLADEWQLIDSSAPLARLIAFGKINELQIRDAAIWRAMGREVSDASQTPFQCLQSSVFDEAALEVAENVTRLARFTSTPIVTEQGGKVFESIVVE